MKLLGIYVPLTPPYFYAVQLTLITHSFIHSFTQHTVTELLQELNMKSHEIICVSEGLLNLVHWDKLQYDKNENRKKLANM